MANPQKENGYTALANELVERLAKLDISGSESRVLLTIWRKTYGFQKKSDAISLSQFKDMTCLSVRTIIRATQDLEAKKMIYVDRVMDDGAKMTNVYHFVKDYDKWVVTSVSLQSKVRREKGAKREAKRRGSVKRVTRSKGSDTHPQSSDTLSQKVVTHNAKKVKSVSHTKEKEITKERKGRKSATTDDSPIIKFTPKDMEVVEMFIVLIQKNFPAWVMRGNKDTWAEDINKLNRIDGYTYEQIEYMIKWVQKDGFWAKNILSGKKLREKFNDLVPKLKEIKSKSKHNEPNYVL